MTIVHNETYHRPAPRRIDADEDERECRRAPRAQGGGEGVARISSSARILLAEDDREFRRLVATRLRSAGYDVTEAPDGGALLDYPISGVQPDGAIAKFDLILSDIHMPHFTALEVLAAARARLAQTPVVLVTAFGDPLTHARAMQLGAVAVIDKPFRLDDLCALVCQLLADKAPPHKAPEPDGSNAA
jgi:CheY-like chemotaxis protein